MNDKQPEHSRLMQAFLSIGKKNGHGPAGAFIARYLLQRLYWRWVQAEVPISAPMC